MTSNGQSSDNSGTSTPNNRPYGSLAIGVIIGVFLGLGIFFWVVPIVLASDEVLKALIEAEATLLGFFGIIAVYVLTSYDGRLDRFEEKLFKLATEETNVPKIPLRVGMQQIRQALSSIERKKKDFARLSAIIGASLVLSIILSVLALGTIERPICFILSYFALAFFFAATFVLVSVLYQMGEPPERIN